MKQYDVYDAFQKSGLFTTIDHWDFSWYSCHGCGSTISGERYTLEGYTKSPKEEGSKHIIVVCMDCYTKLFQREGESK